ncbi:kiSS-1 receptor-like isoform X1 [Scylla paramamosain]|uniref:kiSS-1 receptor-like isoform X1 n=1 Tax=Scylla paramamosain TaxID=85552 RepID=UPI003083AF10
MDCLSENLTSMSQAPPRNTSWLSGGGDDWCEMWRSGEPLLMGEKYPCPEVLERGRALDNFEKVQVALVVALVVASVAGNAAVVAVISFNRLLRTSVNYYLANLAVADLLITLTCWPTLVNRFTAPLYVLGRSLCKITVLALATCINVSVLTLAVVAGGRLYAVLFPLRALRTSSHPVLLISLLWVASFVLALPGFYVRDTQVVKWNDLVEESCGDVLCSASSIAAFRYYRILLLITMFFLPETVMVLAYSVIVVRLYCVRRGPADRDAPLPAPLPTSDHPHSAARRKVVKMTAAVVAAFTVCWSPLQALSLYGLLSEDTLPEWFSSAEFWAYFLGYCNSAFNPLLYCGCSENFRHGFTSLVLRRPRWRRKTRAGSANSWTPSTLLLRLTSSSLSRTSSGGGRGAVSRQTSNSLPSKTSDSARSSRKANPTTPGPLRSCSRGELISSKHQPENNNATSSLMGEAEALN